MHARTGLLAAVALPWVVSAALAQTAPAADDRMDQFEKRLNELDQKYQSELKNRDEEIARLKGNLNQRSAATTRDAVDQTKQDVLADIDARTAGPFTMRTPASFNPSIGVVSNFSGNISTLNKNPARNRFDIGSVELDLRAPIAPIADGVVILPIAREVESDLFFTDAEDGGGGIDEGIEIEEAYVFLHDFGVNNLTAKLGRFHLRFGRQNILHEHNWPTTDNNFVNKSFLGEEALTDSGLSLSYVIPPDWVGGQYVELVGEVVTGEGGGETTPVLNNDASVDSPAVNLHALWNTNLSDDWNFELGGSFLAGKHDNSGSQDAFLYGLDATLVRTDPTGGFANSMLMFEGIYGNVDTDDGQTQHAKGFYVLGQQQLNRDWYVGIRGDWTQNAVDDSQEVWAISPYVTWYYFEFLRFRMQYQHKDGDVASEDTLYFQCTFTFGAHPPHPYWAMK